MILTDDVVERSARAICQRELANYDCERACMAVHKCVGKLSECVIADARAALEAARYGEMRDCLQDCADDLAAELTDRYFQAGEMHPALKSKYDRDMAPVVKARALLSTIGEPTDIGASVGRLVKRHASGDPFVRNAANEILKRHATFPRVKWEDALTAIGETLEAAAESQTPNPDLGESNLKGDRG